MGVIYYTARYISFAIYLAVWHGTCAWRLQIVLQFVLFKEFSMRTLVSAAVLFATSFAAVAGPGGPTALPEPGVIALVGVGVAALLFSRRSRK